MAAGAAHPGKQIYEHRREQGKEERVRSDQKRIGNAEEIVVQDESQRGSEGCRVGYAQRIRARDGIAQDRLDLAAADPESGANDRGHQRHGKAHFPDDHRIMAHALAGKNDGDHFF